METIFTKIIKREIPASIVYEDDLVLAFLDITQATKGHTLVITKAPYKNIFEVPTDTLKHLIGVVQKLAVAVTSAFDCLGVNILNNNNETAGQTVFHYHMHILPRYEKEELTIKFENNMASLTKDDYKERAAKIIAAL